MGIVNPTWAFIVASSCVPVNGRTDRINFYLQYGLAASFSLQIVGEIKSAREALVEVTSILRNHFYRELSEKDSPPPPEIEPIPSNSITNREAQAAPDPVTATQLGVQNVATAQPSKVAYVKD